MKPSVNILLSGGGTGGFVLYSAGVYSDMVRERERERECVCDIVNSNN